MKLNFSVIINNYIAFFLYVLIPFNMTADEKEDYLAKRKNLLLEQAEETFSYGIKLTPNEQKLDNFLHAFCYQIRNHFLESNAFLPTRSFTDVKAYIENTTIFKILKKMPKGGNLHIHADSTGDASWLINRVIKEDNCYIFMGEGEPVLKGTMRFYEKDKVPAGFVLMKNLAAKNPHFCSEVLSLITMSSQDSNSTNPWIKFNAAFSRVENLLCYKSVFMDYYEHAFLEMAGDQISFLELRTNLDELVDSEGKIYSPNEVIELYREILINVRKQYPQFNLKLIYSDFRTKNSLEASKCLEIAYQLKAQNNDMVVGYDLVGYETSGHSLLYYLDNLLVKASELTKKYKFELPYFFHAGESGWSQDKNIYDAVLLKAKRIGHAFNLFQFPELVKHLLKQKVCLEICPISNQMLGYSRDLRIHPASGYMKQGLACVIGSDDPMLFSTSGLSHDFWEATMAWNLTLTDIKQLCLNSIDYSNLTFEEKQNTRNQWNASWNEFIDSILEELDRV